MTRSWRALAKGARILGHQEAMVRVRRLLAQQGHFIDIQVTGRANLVALTQIPLQDIAAGAIIARLVSTNPSFAESMGLAANWIGGVDPINDGAVREALVYAEHRVPGLISIFDIGTH